MTSAPEPTQASLADRLVEIEGALDAGRYAPGPWQAFLEAAAVAPMEERSALAEATTRVSDKLHRRNGLPTYAFEQALAVEILATHLGVALLLLGAFTGSAAPLVLAAVILGMTLQPLLKIATGLALGLRYGYAYLWRVEPRFKLEYGGFLAAPRWRRSLFHASGCFGSPLAWLLVSVVAAPAHATLGAVLFWVAMAHLTLQAALFGMALAGTRRVPVMGLLRLTSPGGAGYALREGASWARG